VISELARRALTGVPAGVELAETASFYGFEPIPRRGAVVSNDLIDRLRDEDPDG